MHFSELGLHEALLRAVAREGYSTPTPIQQQAIPAVLAGGDLMAAAQTGTGKTAAFTLPILHRFANEPNRRAGAPRVLVLTPTRELAAQVSESIDTYGADLKLKTAVIFGGVSPRPQISAIRAGLDLMVATPGRLLDHVREGHLDLSKIEVFILDEADRMLDMGFIPDVKRIVNMTPSTRYRQTQLFSATFNDDVMNLAGRWTEAAQVVEIEPTQVTTDTVDQKVYITATQDKFNLLYNLITRENMSKVIVFANRRDITRRLNDRLHKKGLNVSLISGDVPQNQRMKTLERFRAGDLQVLIATDVAGRGIHIEGVSHVINYNLPEDPEDYVHRIGRTGRAGASGVSISFACEDDAFLLPQLEQAIGMKLNCVHPETALVADQ